MNTLSKNFKRNEQAKPLHELDGELHNEHIVILGAGPSLNYGDEIIEALAKSGALFILPDIVARPFVRRYPGSKRIIFTVEERSHSYLRGLRGEKIAAYIRANPRNIPEYENDMYRFHFDFDTDVSNSTGIVSPGTVTGAGFAWALKTLHSRFRDSILGIHIHMMGMDFSYPDNQMYARLAGYYLNHDYWTNRETREWNAILKKTTHIVTKGGYAIRSCEEFIQTKKNLEIMMNSMDAGLRILDYSPLGVEHNLVAKWAPKINAE